jgi:hypothetical protein
MDQITFSGIAEELDSIYDTLRSQPYLFLKQVLGAKGKTICPSDTKLHDASYLATFKAGFNTVIDKLNGVSPNGKSAVGVRATDGFADLKSFTGVNVDKNSLIAVASLNLVDSSMSTEPSVGTGVPPLSEKEMAAQAALYEKKMAIITEWNDKEDILLPAKTLATDFIKACGISGLIVTELDKDTTDDMMGVSSASAAQEPKDICKEAVERRTTCEAFLATFNATK